MNKQKEVIKMSNYKTQTKAGLEILDRILINKRLYITAYRDRDKTYIVGINYNVKTGTWGQGYYDYLTRAGAQQAMIDYIANYEIKST